MLCCAVAGLRWLQGIRVRQRRVWTPYEARVRFATHDESEPNPPPSLKKNTHNRAPKPRYNCTLCQPRSASPNAPYICSDVCYDPSTGSKFWGFAAVVINVEQLRSGTDKRLSRLEEQGYNFAVYAPQPGGKTTLVSRTKALPVAPVMSVIPLPSNLNPDLSWRLLVAPAAGWVPAWRAPMLAVVVVVGCLFGLLAFAILVNRRRLIWAVDELKVRGLLGLLVFGVGVGVGSFLGEAWPCLVSL